MNERGEGSGQDSCVAPKGMSSSPALESSRACVGPSHESSGAAGRTPTAQPTCMQQGRSCCAPCLRRCREPTGRGAPLGLRGCGGDGTRCPPPRTAKARTRDARGPLAFCKAGSPGPPRRVREVPRTDRREPQGWRSRYSQSPLEPVLVNMVPPGPEPPRGVRGRGGGGGEPPSDRAGALSTRAQSRPGEALPSRQEKGACAACGASTLGRSPPLPARTGSACGRAVGTDAPIVLVVPAGLGKASEDARVPGAELLLAGRRWQSVLPQ